jgi:hypothetical protein
VCRHPTKRKQTRRNARGFHINIRTHFCRRSNNATEHTHTDSRPASTCVIYAQVEVSSPDEESDDEYEDNGSGSSSDKESNEPSSDSDGEGDEKDGAHSQPICLP